MDTVIEVHLTGAFLWTQAVGRTMLKRAKGGETNVGSIVNISRRGPCRLDGPDLLCRRQKRAKKKKCWA